MDMDTTNYLAMSQELAKIDIFIRNFIQDGEQVAIPVSGGLDSDIVARLCCRAIGPERIKLFIVVQSDMEEKFLNNARALSKSLHTSLAEIHLEKMNLDLIQSLESAEPKGLFRTNTLLDPAKSKCSVRSAVISCYQDKGFLIAGTINRTEKELGFFLTFGDGLAHFRPIAHLYQSELRELAKLLGTAQEVINQEPSAGFWNGQTDLEDFSYWIVNDGPIVFPREFTNDEIRRAERIQQELSYPQIDQVLRLYDKGLDIAEIKQQCLLSEEVIQGLIHIVEKAKKLKNREVFVELEREV